MQPRINGAEKLVEWFGYWPTFHDCKITELRLSGDDCALRIAASEMTAEIDASGHYKAAKHCTVSFQFRRVSDMQFSSDGPAGAIIFEMEWEQASDGSVSVRWDTSIGIQGGFKAQTCSVELEPDGERR